MQSGGGAKNPPWARSNVNTNVAGMNSSLIDPNAMSQQSMMQFQQNQAVFNQNMMQSQGGMSMPMTGQMSINQIAQSQLYPGNVVAYPTPRAINQAMYQNAKQIQPATEQRVFTGTVTKTHEDFGFVDHDVFYQNSVCTKGIPKVNDRVLVEATFIPNMPFKWNATCVQVLAKSGPNQKMNYPKPLFSASSLQAVKKQMQAHDDRPMRRDDRIAPKRSRTRSRSRSRDRRESRESRDARSRRESPPRKRPAPRPPTPIAHVVRVPRIPLHVEKMDVPSLSHRYTNLYIPSDFFNVQVKWSDSFPPQNPFSLNNPCDYHIMSKEAINPDPNDAILEPPDADYRFSAKVMLISMPTLECLYQKCGLSKSDEKEKDKRSNKNARHPTRLIKFLVGQKGKVGENFAIGGPWSPSLDGENPQSDPGVLVKTAIRTCKALTGIDLSNCTQWYRMVEFYYWRESAGGRSRLECVVFYLPDVWSVQTSRNDWPALIDKYRAAPDSAPHAATTTSTPAPVATTDQPADESIIGRADDNDQTIVIDENDDDETPEPTHYSKLDLRTMKVDELRQELRARNVSCKGPRAQLISRLSKLVKSEEEKDNGDDVMEVDDDEQQGKGTTEDSNEKKDASASSAVDIGRQEEKTDKKEENGKKDKSEDTEKKEEKKSEKEIEDEKRKLEREKAAIRSRQQLPSTPHIVVHPSATARAGKFTCSTATLSLLLDYCLTDNKEHSFELFVFAELFNEMLMRDFGFYIYKILHALPPKTEETKDEKNKTSEKSVEKSNNRSDRKETEKKDDKKDDKRDEKHDSRRRDRRDSPSEDEKNSIDLPPDPYLLLSLIYFDTSRGGTITKKEMQNLFLSLGLQLSRSQIRPLLEKVCVKENFIYRNLYGVIKDLTAGVSEEDTVLDLIISGNLGPQITENETSIATGNRDLLPMFDRPDSEKKKEEKKDISDSGVVWYCGRVVDVSALLAAGTRGGAERTRLDAALQAARVQLRAARDALTNARRTERAHQHKLEHTSAALRTARNRVASLTASTKIFHSVLKSIQSKVEAVININYEEEEVVEISNDSDSQVKKESRSSSTEANGPVSKTENKEVKSETVDDKDDVKTEGNGKKPVVGEKKETVVKECPKKETFEKESAKKQTVENASANTETVEKESANKETVEKEVSKNKSQDDDTGDKDDASKKTTDSDVLSENMDIDKD